MDALPNKEFQEILYLPHPKLQKVVLTSPSERSIGNLKVKLRGIF